MLKGEKKIQTSVLKGFLGCSALSSSNPRALRVEESCSWSCCLSRVARPRSTKRRFSTSPRLHATSQVTNQSLKVAQLVTTLITCGETVREGCVCQAASVIPSLIAP